MEQIALKVRDRLGEIFDRFPTLPSEMADTLASGQAGGGIGWLWSAILIGGLLTLLAYGTGRLISLWGREYFRYLYNPNPAYRREKIGYIFLRASTGFAEALVGGLLAALAILAITSDPDTRTTALTMLGAYLAARLGWIFLSVCWPLMRRTIGCCPCRQNRQRVSIGLF